MSKVSEIADRNDVKQVPHARDLGYVPSTWDSAETIDGHRLLRETASGRSGKICVLADDESFISNVKDRR